MSKIKVSLPRRTAIADKSICDPNISFATRGLHHLLLSLSGKRIDIESLEEYCFTGEEKLLDVYLTELQSCGYIYVVDDEIIVLEIPDASFTSSKKKTSKPKGDFGDYFDEWWKRYRAFCKEVKCAPGDRQSALKAWKSKVKNQADLNDLLSKFEIYAHHWTKEAKSNADGKAYGVPHGRTFLSQERWKSVEPDEEIEEDSQPTVYDEIRHEFRRLGRVHPVVHSEWRVYSSDGTITGMDLSHAETYLGYLKELEGTVVVGPWTK